MKTRKIAAILVCALFTAAAALPALAGNGKGSGGSGKGAATATKTQAKLKDGSCLTTGQMTRQGAGSGSGAQSRDGSCLPR